jgi:hypothetical protein
VICRFAVILQHTAEEIWEVKNGDIGNIIFFHLEGKQKLKRLVRLSLCSASTALDLPHGAVYQLQLISKHGAMYFRQHCRRNTYSDARCAGVSKRE